MSKTWIDLAYLVAAILFIIGIKRLSHPRTARSGNWIAAVGMAIAVGFTFASIRSMTRKPPTMLIIPKTTATNPSTCSSVESALPTTSIPPMSTIPWIAFVPGHQRRVQHRRHLGDDLDADEDRQGEDRQLGNQLRSHAGAFCLVTQAPLVISSSKSSWSSPSGARCWSRADTLRA